MAGSASGLYVGGIRARHSASGRPAKRARTTKSGRSVWNSADDWDELVATTTLSTASVSTRPPRPRGLQTLVLCAENAAARSFKRLYESGKQRTSSGDVGEGFWELEWAYVPDLLKCRVREAVYKRHGGLIKVDMVRDLFLVPPDLHLPGHLIPVLASTSTLKGLTPQGKQSDLYTHLRIQHCPQLTDAAVAALIQHMPNLESVNLKGCSLVGTRTTQMILKTCPNIRGINLKGTKISEGDMKLLLDKFGHQLERLKFDGIPIQNPDDLFSADLYPHLTHLCIPGDIINAPAQSFTARAKQFGHTIAHPAPRPTPENALFTWRRMGEIFPKLTHLYLPGLLVPSDTSIKLESSRLVKLSLGPGGPPVPIMTLASLISSQKHTLRTIHIGHLLPVPRGLKIAMEFDNLASALEGCTSLEGFRFICDPGGSKNLHCDQAMHRFSSNVYSAALKGPWRATLKDLQLSVPQKIDASAFGYGSLHADEAVPALENLSLAAAEFSSCEDLASALSAFRNLRTLDLSGTAITTEQVYRVLDSCALLSRVDLTSCRGVGVRLRRTIFQAWKEDREARNA